MKPGRRIVEDAARGELKEIYAPVDAFGQGTQAFACRPIRAIPWDKIDLNQFNLVPKVFHGHAAKSLGAGWGTFRIIPVESGRGCPYGCEFCTVTGFFGDSIRFRTNESVVNELLLLKARAEKRARPDRGVFSSTTISPSTSSAPNRCCATSSRPKRRCTGWRRSAPICCATKNWWI